MLNTCYEPCTLNALFPIPPITLAGGYYSSSFRNEEIDPQRSEVTYPETPETLTRDTMLISGKISGKTAVKTQVCLPPTPVLWKA